MKKALAVIAALALLPLLAAPASAAPKRSATLAIPASIAYGDTVDPDITVTGRETGSGYFYQTVWCSQPAPPGVGNPWFESPTSYSRDNRFGVDRAVTFTNEWANSLGGPGSGTLDPSQPSNCYWSVLYSRYATGPRFELDMLVQVPFTLLPQP